MTVLGLRFCARALPSCGKWGPLFTAVRGPLTIAASPVAKHRLQTRRLSNCGSRAQPLRGMRDPPRPGLEPVSPASAGRLSTTAPPRKPSISSWLKKTVSLYLETVHEWNINRFIARWLLFSSIALFWFQSDNQFQSSAHPNKGSTGPAPEGIRLHSKRIIEPENMWGSE